MPIPFFMERCTCLLFCVLLLIMLPFGAWSQRHYQPGYVVLQQGDTLYGKIKDRRPEPFGKIYESIRFRNGGLFAKRYGPQDLQWYKAGERLYESCWLSYDISLFSTRMISIPGRGQKEFMRVLVKGPLTYYSLETTQDDSGYYNDIPYLKREDKSEFVRATQGIFGLRRKLLAEYFNDCEKLQEALHNNDVSTVFEIVNFYQQHCIRNIYYNRDGDK